MFNDHQWQKGNWVAQTDPLPFLPTPSCTLQITVRHLSPCHIVCLRTNKKKSECCLTSNLKNHLDVQIVSDVFYFSMTGEPFSPDHSPNPSWTSGDRAEPRGGGPEKLAAVQLLLPLKHLSTATTTPTPTHTDNVRDTPRDICLGLRSQSHRQHPIEMFESVPWIPRRRCCCCSGTREMFRNAWCAPAMPLAQTWLNLNSD